MTPRADDLHISPVVISGLFLAIAALCARRFWTVYSMLGSSPDAIILAQMWLFGLAAPLSLATGVTIVFRDRRRKRNAPKTSDPT
jgi:hypothetical protein